MSERYGYCEDGHTAWCVYDNQDRRRVVSKHALEQDARAEAARLNAEAPKRAAAVELWAVFSPRGHLFAESIRWEREDIEAWPLMRGGDRIARVRIEEISDDE